MSFSRLSLVVVGASSLVIAACGDDGGGSGGPDADVGPSALLDPPPEGEGLQIGLGIEIAGGAEAEYCQYIVLPPDATLEVERFEHRYSAGSHHLIVYQTGLAATDVTDEIFECAGASFTALGVTGISYAAQVPDGELVYPDDVALPIGEQEVILLNTHYLNTTDAALDADVRVNMWYADQPATHKAGTLFFYDWAIHVPASGSSVARMRCGIPEDINLIFGMSHMHRRGVGYEARLTGGSTDQVMLYETTSWEDVEPLRYEPIKQVEAGQVVDFHCNYEGDGNATVEGPSADGNEMCMFIAAYWPRLDFATEACQGPGSGPVFEGDETCGTVFTCMTNADNEVDAELCLFDTCEASTPALSALTGCIFQNCAAECEAGGTACTTCMFGTCGEQYSSCADATCE